MSAAVHKYLEHAPRVSDGTVIFVELPLAEMDVMAAAIRILLQVQQQLQAWAKAAGYHISQKDLRLETIWPNKRDRWWGLVYPIAIPKLHIQPLPILPRKPVLADILPKLPEWAEDEEKELTLDEREKRVYVECKCLRASLVKFDEPVRTLLHGMANQLGLCPCGCRTTALSQDRLKTKGIFSALAILSKPGTYGDLEKAETRHLHAWEMP